MHIFDYNFLHKELVPAELVNYISGIYYLKSSSETLFKSHQEIFTELEKVAKVQSIKSSNAIEGIVTSDSRILSIVNQNSAPLNHDEEEIAGYRDALSIVHTNHSYLEINKSNILNLHKTMLQNKDDAGKYKNENNLIIEIDPYGKKRIRFTPIEASETDEAMQQLILAYASAKNDSEINPLLLIPCVILDFLCIHPFNDGNGRMSRLLSLLLLYKNGFNAAKYISFEEQINNHKRDYYVSLKESSELWHENKNNYFPFIINFIKTLYQCYKELGKRFAIIGDLRMTKSARIESTVLDSLVPLSKSEINQILPDISATTIEAVVGKMVKEQRIIKIGSGRNTKYFKSS